MSGIPLVFLVEDGTKKIFFFQFIIKIKNQPMKTLIIISFILAGSFLWYVIYNELKNY